MSGFQRRTNLQGPNKDKQPGKPQPGKAPAKPPAAKPPGKPGKPAKLNWSMGDLFEKLDGSEGQAGDAAMTASTESAAPETPAVESKPAQSVTKTEVRPEKSTDAPKSSAKAAKPAGKSESKDAVKAIKNIVETAGHMKAEPTESVTVASVEAVDDRTGAQTVEDVRPFDAAEDAASENAVPQSFELPDSIAMEFDGQDAAAQSIDSSEASAVELPSDDSSADFGMPVEHDFPETVEHAKEDEQQFHLEDHAEAQHAGDFADAYSDYDGQESSGSVDAEPPVAEFDAGTYESPTAHSETAGAYDSPLAEPDPSSHESPVAESEIAGYDQPVAENYDPDGSAEPVAAFDEQPASAEVAPVESFEPPAAQSDVTDVAAEMPASTALDELNAIAGAAEEEHIEIPAAPTRAKSSALDELNAIADAAAESFGDGTSAPVADQPAPVEPQKPKPSAEKIDGSAAALLLKKAKAKKSEIMRQGDSDSGTVGGAESIEPAAASSQPSADTAYSAANPDNLADSIAAQSNTGSFQPPSQFKRELIKDKLGDQAKPETPGAPAPPAKSNKVEISQNSKFVEKLLSMAQASGDKSGQMQAEKEAKLQEMKDRTRELMQSTGKMKKVMDTVPTADEMIVSRATVAKVVTAKERIVEYKYPLMGVAAVLLVVIGTVIFMAKQEEAGIEAKLKVEYDAKHFHQVIKAADKILDKRPNDPKAHLYKGIGLSRIKPPNLAEALLELNRALELDGSDMFALSWRASVERDLGQLNESLADYTKVDSSGGVERPAQVKADKATVENMLGQTPQAIADINAAIKLEPKNDSYKQILAGCYASAGKFQDSLNVWNKLIAKSPRDPILYANRGRVQFQAKHTDKALADLAQSIDLKPTATAYSFRGFIERDLHQLPQAIKDFGEALKYDPNNAAIIEAKATCAVNRGDFASAVKDFDLLDTLRKNSEQGSNQYFWRLRAEARLRAHEYKQAADDLSQLITLNPQDMHLRYQRADAYEKAGENQRAYEDYSYLIEHRKNDADLYARRAVISTKQDQTALATADFEQALKLKPNDPSVYLARGLASAEIGQISEAMIDLKHVLQLQPNNAVARQKMRELSRYKTTVASSSGARERGSMKGDPINVGYELMVNGDTQGAIDKFAAAIKANPNNAAARRYLAAILKESGDHAAAAKQYDALQALGALNDPVEQLTYAKQLVAANRQRDAVMVYIKRLRATPDDSDVRHELASLYSDLGAIDKAKMVCDEGMKLAKSKEEYDEYDMFMQKLQAKTLGKQTQGAPSGE